MSAVQTLSALVLGHTDYGDNDRIVQLITAEQGRISAIARGARSSKKRFTGSLELGSRIEATLRRGKGELWQFQAAELIHGHPHIRGFLESIALSAYCCEVVRETGRREQPEPKLFGLLDVALLVLDACTEPPQAAFRLGFEAKALSFAGLTPVLTQCAGCGLAAEGPMVWSVSGGGMVHSACGVGPQVTASWAQAVEGFRRTPLAELVDTKAPAGGSPWLLSELMIWHQGRPLRSRELLITLEGG
ncbi:MAG: DNA repair protein RecO (recombination protein O) [Cognaticolwellia sp.]|jgi:DNA repair protein RecO (recombination protein O)